MRPIRRCSGSIAAEQMAVLIVLFLGIFFPLCNIATSFYRYGLVLQAVHNGAHVGSTAQTWTAGTSPTAVMAIVPPTINNFVRSTSGITNAQVHTRIIETNTANNQVNRLADDQRLPYDPKPGFIYSLECTLTCNVAPLVTFDNGLVPKVPGMTSPYPTSLTARQLLENPDGMVN